MMVEENRQTTMEREKIGSNSGETIIIPFSEIPSWVKEEWVSLHGKTRPKVRVYRTTVAEIPVPVFDYAVRDIIAYKNGRTMRTYIPSYRSLLAATPEQKTLYFGGAVRLESDEAIAVMDYWEDRYQNIDLYVHPEAYEPPKVIGPALTERQRKILATIRAYTSAYRRDVFETYGVTKEELDELRKLGLIDKRSAITMIGRNMVGKESF